MVRYYMVDGMYLDVDQTMEMAESSIGRSEPEDFIKYREGLIKVSNITVVIDLEK